MRKLMTAVLITREAQWPEAARVDFPFAEVIIETRCTNILRRYELAAKAQYDHIYFQDDDCTIDVHRLERRYDSSHITNAITLGHKMIYQDTGITLVGWGTFFPKYMAQAFLDVRDSWTRMFDEATVLAEADRLFTWQFQPHKNIIMPINQWQNPARMSARPGHYATKDHIIATLKGLA